MFDEAERPRAVAYGVRQLHRSPLGPILGGWILSNAWWGWIFLMNVPVALVGLIAVVALVPESRSAKRPSIDFGGVILSSAGLVAVMYGVVQAAATAGAA